MHSTWKSTLRRAAALLVLGSLARLEAGGGAVPVRWGGSTSSNMVSAARGLPDDLEAVKPLWELRLGTHQYSIPTVDRGRIYLGTDDSALDRPGVKRTGGGLLLCVDQATGKTIWRFPTPRYTKGVIDPYHFDQWKCGFCSGPVVDGDRVYVVGSRGEVLCLDRDGQANGNDGPFLDELAYMGAEKVSGAELGPADGDIIWRYDFLRELDVVPHDVCGSTLLLHGDLLYACTSNGVDGSHARVPRPLAPSLIVLDKHTGRLVAKDGERIGERMLHGHWSSPAFGSAGGRDMIFFGGGDGVLYAFEPARPAPEGSEPQTLRKVWSHDCNPPDYRARDGKPVPYSRWNKNSPDGPSEIIGTPVFFEGRVYVTIGQSPIHGVGRGQLSAIDAATGREVWASRLVDRSLATPSVAGGLVYVVDYSGYLHCFDAETGDRCWAHELGAGAWGASTFVADGKVYASGENDVVWVLRAGREKRVLSSAEFESVPITPAAAGGVLYLATQRRLLALPGGGGEREGNSGQTQD